MAVGRHPEIRIWTGPTRYLRQSRPRLVVEETGLHVTDENLPQAEREALIREAHERICPYLHAARGNVQVDLEVTGA